MNKILLLFAAIVFSTSAFSQSPQSTEIKKDSVQEKVYARINILEADIQNAKEMNIEPIKPIERAAFDDFCGKIASPFLRIPKAHVGETRRMLVYATKLPVKVDYDAVARYIMICALSTGLKISCCTIVDIDTVRKESENSIEAEILGSSFWNAWKIEDTKQK